MSNTTAIVHASFQAKQRFTYQCPECGSTDVAHDATASWDHDLQRFVLVCVQDACTCRACDYEDNSGSLFFKVVEG